MVFSKGNNYKFKEGNIPHNKKRKCAIEQDSDLKASKYIRLTKQKHSLVVNDPYTDPEEKSKRTVRAAKLLRPKSDESLQQKPQKKSAVKDKRWVKY